MKLKKEFYFFKFNIEKTQIKYEEIKNVRVFLKKILSGRTKIKTKVEDVNAKLKGCLELVLTHHTENTKMIQTSPWKVMFDDQMAPHVSLK